ncbi:MAG: 5-oxoprolinase subunit PxpA [Planctomycetota bacterium]
MKEALRREIDLNCDLGEGGPHDAAVMPLVTSANVACGGHAGDETTMAVAVGLARRHGVAIGAHPGHADRQHFGRRELPITPAAAARLVVEQVERLDAIAGEPPRHVKLHGGLYHQAARDVALGSAVADALVARWPALILVAPAASPLVAVARERGLEVAEEAFIDRGYTAAGRLVPRSQAGAVITAPQTAAARAVRLVRDGLVETRDGGDLALRADTLCIHGDGSDPAALAKAVREALAEVGIAVRRVAR